MQRGALDLSQITGQVSACDFFLLRLKKKKSIDFGINSVQSIDIY